jgi:hypothetical protein
MYAYVWFLVNETKFLIFIGKTICLQMQQSAYFLTQLIGIAWTLLFMSFYMLVSRCVFLEQSSYFEVLYVCWQWFMFALSCTCDEFLINKCVWKFSGFKAIPMIFLQVVQLLSQACCLPLPELLKLKLQSSTATSRFAKSIEIDITSMVVLSMSY